ncbi:resolvase domain protein [Caldicellulosiruptor obsidiansis OB47]|uniref:Resolvase domain protein n=1 Tax=Caldicellulosiruptor obsidiansis (strain ATCC BAA-2073 / JCM 16842 / OB47) TaxID=608506 RepID=D9TIY3_CALOO|nr:resolvase domain protein [Caldicellulosiruptor obsidiansis OB47]
MSTKYKIRNAKIKTTLTRNKQNDTIKLEMKKVNMIDEKIYQIY